MYSTSENAPNAQPLWVQLNQIDARLARVSPGEVHALIDHKTEQLELTGIGDKALKVGDRAPDFRLPDSSGNTVRLNEQLEQGPVVLNFFRGGSSPRCMAALHAFEQARPEFDRYRARLLAVSPELSEQLRDTARSANVQYPLLSDISNRAARQFGLVFRVEGLLQSVYEDIGVDIPNRGSDDSFELPIPATYLIDQQGVIQFAFVSADHRRRAEASEVLDVLSGR